MINPLRAVVIDIGRTMRRFPEIGVPQNHPFFWNFPLYTIHWWYPYFRNPPCIATPKIDRKAENLEICGKHHNILEPQPQLGNQYESTRYARGSVWYISKYHLIFNINIIKDMFRYYTMMRFDTPPRYALPQKHELLVTCTNCEALQLIEKSVHGQFVCSKTNVEPRIFKVWNSIFIKKNT